jgi:hypothetical protein
VLSTLPEVGADSKDGGGGVFLLCLVSRCSDLSGFVPGSSSSRREGCWGGRCPPRRRLPRPWRRPDGARRINNSGALLGRGHQVPRGEEAHDQGIRARVGVACGGDASARWRRARGGSSPLRIGGRQVDGGRALPCGVRRLPGLLPT